MGLLFVDSCTEVPGFLLRILAGILISVGGVGIIDCEVRGRGRPLTHPVFPWAPGSITLTPVRFALPRNMCVESLPYTGILPA